jgi:hypothetical protein
MASPFYSRPVETRHVARPGPSPSGSRAGRGRVRRRADEMQGPSAPVRRDACATRPRQGDTYVRVGRGPARMSPGSDAMRAP